MDALRNGAGPGLGRFLRTHDANKWDFGRRGTMRSRLNAHQNISMARWEHFAHGADVGVRGFGESIEQAFEQAALALSAVAADISTVAPSESVEVQCEAPDLELLLVSWLNAIVFEMAVRKMIFSKFHATISGTKLNGTLFGETVDLSRHDVAVEVKGATVTALKVVRTPDGSWMAQCVVDV